MSQLTLYTNPQSRGRIARWMMEESDQPYRTVVLEFGAPMRTPEFLALNPMGKVPVLVHDDTVVTEAAAICAYMALTFPETELAPQDGEQADFYRWMFFAAGPLEQAVTAHALGLEPGPEKRSTVGYGDFATTIETLESKLKATDYLAGHRFTAADVYLGAHIAWGLRIGTIPETPAISAYHARISARPAFLRAQQLDNALMGGDGDG